MNLIPFFLNDPTSGNASRGALLLAIGIWFVSLHTVDAATITAKSASRADVGAAVSLANDRDTVTIPAGSATWTSTLTVTKNISIIGAGEGSTIITENLSRTDSPPLFDVSLTKELAAPDYSFRLSGMTLKSINPTLMASDKAFLMLYGNSDPALSYVRGNVSRVRIDHITFDNLPGMAIRPDSVLGVMDHLTIDNGTRNSSPIRCNNVNWTPATNPATGAALPTTFKASDSFGSWADDAYFGTDKFLFIEDSNFTSIAGVADDEEGARVVYRHNTVNGGTGFASHGMEGRKQPGVRAREIYNNYCIMTSNMAQTRSGSVLYFNNKSTQLGSGIVLKPYRFHAIYKMWGGISGDNRYDVNQGSPIVASGTISAVESPGSATTKSVTVGASDDLSGVNLSDGTIYTIFNISDLYVGEHSGSLGWKYNQSGISSIAGRVVSLITGTTPDSAKWQVGHSYQIRKTTASFGQPGTGKGNLLNAGTAVNGYADTWNYPATSGALAGSPLVNASTGLRYPLEPCYSWNNTDNTNGYLGFSLQAPYLVAGRDYFNLTERTIETQNVGYPAVSYTRATSDYPKIGPGQTISYTPYTYPHPLTLDQQGPPSPTPTPTPTATPDAPQNVQIAPGG